MIARTAVVSALVVAMSGVLPVIAGDTEVVTDTGLITDGPRCDEFQASVYDATREYFYTADLRACPGGLYDLTYGENYPLPGQEMIFSPGHEGRTGAWRFVRAYPNEAYRFIGTTDEQIGTLIGSANPPGWNETNTILPFVPHKVSPTTSGDAYFYHEMEILDRGLAAPLDENSVLTGMDGWMFETPTGLLDALAEPVASQYRQVWYYDRTDPNQTRRRAYIRVLRQSSDDGQWSAAKPSWAPQDAPVPPSVAAAESGREERSTGEKIAEGVIVFAAIWLMSELLTSGSSSGSSSGSYGGGGGGGSSSRDRYPEPERNTSPSSGNNDSSGSPSDGLYGDCHGGAAYGC